MKTRIAAYHHFQRLLFMTELNTASNSEIEERAKTLFRYSQWWVRYKKKYRGNRYDNRHGTFLEVIKSIHNVCITSIVFESHHEKKANKILQFLFRY